MLQMVAQGPRTLLIFFKQVFRICFIAVYFPHAAAFAVAAFFPDEAGHVLHRIAQEAADLVGEPFFQAGPALQPGEHRVHPLCDGIAKPDKAILDVWAAELLF